MSSIPILGRVVATERSPNTPHEFQFWTAVESAVGIGTIVRVDGTHPIAGQLPRVYGVVTEGFSYTDLAAPMFDVMGHDGDPARAPFAATERTEVRLYRAAVLRQIPEEPMQPVPMGDVHLADDAAPRPGDDDEGGAPGFGEGLSTGWDAVTALAGALATALGFALPFAPAVVAFGSAAWWVRRRRLHPDPEGT